MKKNLKFIALGFAGVASMMTPRLAHASGTWTALTHQPSFQACEPQLMTDGTVLVEEGSGSGHVWKLTPDNTGSYVNGTWTQMASMITPRLFYAGSVLADGRLIVCGGEYSGSGLTNNWTNKCEIYNPVLNTWTSLTPPSGWSMIGDAPSMVFPNGKFLLGSDFNHDTAIFDPTTNTFSAGPNSLDSNSDEETWALLPNNRILSVMCANAPGSQYFDIAGNNFVNIGSTPSNLVDAFEELGPSLLLPNGNVFQIGGTPFTAIYNPTSNSWSSGPAVPMVTWPGATVNNHTYPPASLPLCCDDAPGAMLPNGKVLIAMGPFTNTYTSNNVDFAGPVSFVESDGTTMSVVPTAGYQDALTGPYIDRLIVLPTGQVLFTESGATDGSGKQVFIYTPDGTYQSAWQPTITAVSTTLAQSSTNNAIQGTQLNGISQGSSYGDDSWHPTNYPIVRVQNIASGHVFYARTHNHSTMGVATGSTVVSTQFDLPATVELGPSNLFVVANGIPSNPQAVVIVAPHVVLPTTYSLFRGILSSGSLASLFFADGSTLAVLTGPTLSSSEAPVQIQASGTTTVLTPTSFQITVTSKVNTVGTTQKILLFNFVTSAYETVDSVAGTSSNQTRTVSATGTLSRFVNPGTGEVRARLTFIQTGPVTTSRWLTNTDVLNWIIQ